MLVLIEKVIKGELWNFFLPSIWNFKLSVRLSLRTDKKYISFLSPFLPCRFYNFKHLYSFKPRHIRYYICAPIPFDKISTIENKTSSGIRILPNFFFRHCECDLNPKIKIYKIILRNSLLFYVNLYCTPHIITLII
jgi:hypothetical protein